MKYLPLLWSSLWRKKVRTIFTLLSVFVALRIRPRAELSA